MKKKLCFILSLILVLSVFPFAALRADAAVKDVSFYVTYNQTEARKITAMVNNLRTAGSWCWNSDDTEKVPTGKLSALTYDYSLEKTAMTRVAEIVLNFAHTRPDMSQCFTAFEDGYSWKGENIAWGYTDAEEVFKGWLEEDCNYSGQGHRRNMLKSEFTAIGIAVCKHDGMNFWVMELGSPVSKAAYTAPKDGKTGVTVKAEDMFADKVIQDYVPDEPTTKPDEPTTKPDEPTTKPDEPTTKPDEPTTKPDEPTTKPDEPTTKPDEPTSLNTGEEVSVFGELDGDPGISVEDARLALRFAVKLEKATKQQLKAGDVDGDGSISVEDARLILRVAVKLENAEDFPAAKK